MATPKYDILIGKVRDWSNKPQTETIADSVLADCLTYAADDIYRDLRIPPLEYTIKYTITSADNVGDAGVSAPFGQSYSVIPVPEDLTEMILIRRMGDQTVPAESIVYSEVTDQITFFDNYAEKYSMNYYMISGRQLFVRPQLQVGSTLELRYYRRLAALNATYAVVALNYLIDVSDALQPYLTLTGIGTDTPLYFSTLAGVTKAFNSSAEATAYATPVTTKYYIGKEVPHWLRDQNEQMVLWGALGHMGAYLFDDKMEQRYTMKKQFVVDKLNKEEVFRKATGGNIQMNLNGNGLI